jgi:hypothetical protein
MQIKSIFFGRPRRKVDCKLDTQSDLDEILHVAQMLSIFTFNQEIILQVKSLN